MNGQAKTKRPGLKRDMDKDLRSRIQQVIQDHGGRWKSYDEANDPPAIAKMRKQYRLLDKQLSAYDDKQRKKLDDAAAAIRARGKKLKELVLYYAVHDVPLPEIVAQVEKFERTRT